MKHKNNLGFTLIEIIIFILIMGIIGSTVLVAMSAVLRGDSTSTKQTIALQAAKRCMEWYVNQRYLNGFNAPALICSNNTTAPSFCVSPSGYNINTSVSCTQLYGDTAYNYKTITVNVNSGGSNAASLSLLLANY